MEFQHKIFKIEPEPYRMLFVNNLQKIFQGDYIFGWSEAGAQIFHSKEEVVTAQKITGGHILSEQVTEPKPLYWWQKD